MSSQYPFAFALSLLLSGSMYAQSGCTDPSATNYSPSATVNDGSCTYPVTHYSPVFRASFPSDIKESSGLVWTNGALWTHDDSGHPSDIFSVDTTTGAILKTVVVDNYPNVDWEAITADSNYIYIGDHGNNNGTRKDLKVLKIAKSDITAGSTVHVNAQAISFSYTDQTSFTSSSTHNFDCEALISIGDSLYIFTKDRGDLQTRVYKMPKTPGTYALTPYTGYNVNGLITDASYNAATKEIVLIGYFSGHANSFLWFLNDFNGDMFFSGNKRRIEIGNGTDWQTEGVAYLSNDRFFVSCESASPNDASVYLGTKTFHTTAVKNHDAALPCEIYPNPASGILYVNGLNTSAVYTITDLNGRLLQNGTLEAGDNKLHLNALSAGTYIITLNDNSGASTSVRFTTN